jgi:hypothetical protein
MAEGASPDAWTRLFDDPDFFQLAEDTLADRGRDTEEARAVDRVYREPAMTEHLIDDSANQCAALRVGSPVSHAVATARRPPEERLS